MSSKKPRKANRSKSRRPAAPTRPSEAVEVEEVELPVGWPSAEEIAALVPSSRFRDVMRAAADRVERSALAKRLEQFTVERRRHVLGHIRVPHAPRVRNAMVDRLLSFVVEDPTSHLVPDLWQGLTYLIDTPEFTGEQWAALVSGEKEAAVAVLGEADMRACALLAAAGAYPEMEQRLVLAAGCEKAPLAGLALSILAVLDDDLVGDLERVRADYPAVPVANRTLAELGSLALDELSRRGGRPGCVAGRGDRLDPRRTRG